MNSTRRILEEVKNPEWLGQMKPARLIRGYTGEHVVILVLEAEDGHVQEIAIDRKSFRRAPFETIETRAMQHAFQALLGELENGTDPELAAKTAMDWLNQDEPTAIVERDRVTA